MHIKKRLFLTILLIINVKCLAIPAFKPRIISLAPDITETLFAIGAGDQIVGVMKGSDFPEAAKKLPVIGSYNSLDIERILLLKPDLIITWGNTFIRQLAALQRFHIRVYVTNPLALEDIPKQMRDFGRLTRHEATANKAAALFMQQLQNLTANYQAQKKVTVFYQLGDSLMTINKNSWINQAITLCGGENIFAQATTITPEVNIEAVLSINPDAILSDASTNLWKQRWQRWPTLTAVKQQHLYNINADWIDRAGPRLIKGVEQVCIALYNSRQK